MVVVGRLTVDGRPLTFGVGVGTKVVVAGSTWEEDIRILDDSLLWLWSVVRMGCLMMVDRLRLRLVDNLWL